MAQLKNTLKELVDGIFTITINRPAKMNALNSETLDELKALIYEAYDNNDVYGVIITGSGDKAFVAGADINEFKDLNGLNARKYSENGQEILSLIENCHKPVIAVVNGYALGGGCELALACHIRIASENAKFGQPEVRLGIIPGFGGTQRLTQLIGKGQALEMLMTGEVVDTKKAIALGLVNDVL
ncbi:MAG: enoyl-CoA hydratase, partial [Deltaproteobacteria bacterium]